MEKKIKIILAVVIAIVILITGILIYSSNKKIEDSEEISNQIANGFIEEEEVNIGTVQVPNDLNEDNISDLISGDLLENNEEIEIGELI